MQSVKDEANPHEGYKMPISIFDRRPGRALRAVLRLPVLLYRLGLGWLLRDRFLLLMHTGRRSGLLHQTVIEVVWHDTHAAAYYVVSGWGKRADWYRNVRAHPSVIIQVGSAQYRARADCVPVDDAIGVIEKYSREHPLAFRELSRLFLGQQLGPGHESARLLAEKMPMVALRVHASPTYQAGWTAEKDIRMFKKIMLFAPVTFDLAETTRMIEIAKGIRDHPQAHSVFDIQFISNGGNLEHLIEEEGFPLQRLEPRFTPEKIEFFGKVDKGEIFAPAFSDAEMEDLITNEVAYLEEIRPACVVTGSYVTIPVTCRILGIPLIWVIQSTWLEDFFAHGAGMTDSIRFGPLKVIADWFILLFINFWIRYGFLGPVNRAAHHFGVPGYRSIFDYWRGDVTLVAEPPEFSGVRLPKGYYYTGPLIAKEDFHIPKEVRDIPRDRPIIYFAMGSSGTPEIIANIIESFEGKPYRVIAPVKDHLEKVPGVKVPSNVIVTDWLPAHIVNPIADLSLIHGGIGTVMTAALSGKPVVGIGMQPEQVANLACLVRKGFAIRVPKSRDPSRQVQAAITRLLADAAAKRKALEFSRVVAKWNGPKEAAELLYREFGNAGAPA